MLLYNIQSRVIFQKICNSIRIHPSAGIKNRDIFLFSWKTNFYLYIWLELQLNIFIMEHTESIGKLISILHRQSQIYFQKKLDPIGMGRGQVKIFTYLANARGATQQEITAFFRLDKGTTSYLIKKMETGGYIRRVPDLQDRRSSKLYLTEKATQKEKVIRKIFQGWAELLLKGFSSEERQQAFKLMHRMTDNTSSLKEEKS